MGTYIVMPSHARQDGESNGGVEGSDSCDIQWAGMNEIYRLTQVIGGVQ